MDFIFLRYNIINGYAQAAASLEALKVKDSPIKKIDFNLEDKENMPVAFDSSELTATPVSDMEKKPLLEVKQQIEQPQKPKTPKELEKEEPLLQENAHRFVLFPLKYHEIVRVISAAPPAEPFPCPELVNLLPGS